MSIVDRLPYEPWRERGAVVDDEFRWRLGVRPLDLDDWIELGPDADAWIVQKPGLLDRRRDTVFAVLDDIEREATEVAAALVDHLRRRWPRRYAGITLDGGLHPLDAASRLVPEDLVLMVERDGRLVFGGGSVCFPNRWDLRSKLGRSMAEVHEPVARLNDQLEAGVDAFLSRLAPERSFWRLGWGIIDVPDGHAPPGGIGLRPAADPTLDDLFVRVERETLRRFAGTNCVLFTIRTYVTPLTNVLADPDSAPALGAAVGAMGADVRGYKDLILHAEAIVRRAGPAGSRT